MPNWSFDRVTARRTIVGFVVASLGGTVFHLLHFPAPWIAGATVFVAAASLMRVETTLPRWLRDVIFVLLGLSMGAGVTPDTVARLPDWPVSLMLLAVTVVGVTAGAFLFFRRVAGWDRPTAMMAAIPGALSYVMAVAIGNGADLRRVAVAQTIRLLILVVLLPLAIAGSGTALAAQTIPEPAWRDLALLLGIGVSVALAAARLGVPAGLLTGAFVASSVMHGAGIVDAAVPMWIQIPCFLGMGITTGARFAGTDLALLRATLAVSIGGFLVGTGLALVGALLTVLAIDVGWAQAMLSFAPGGLEVMMALSFALGVDPAFVATHQLFRFMGIALLMPAALAALERRAAP